MNVRVEKIRKHSVPWFGSRDTGSSVSINYIVLAEIQSSRMGERGKFWGYSITIDEGRPCTEMWAGMYVEVFQKETWSAEPTYLTRLMEMENAWCFNIFRENLGFLRLRRPQNLRNNAFKCSIFSTTISFTCMVAKKCGAELQFDLLV